MTKQQYTKTRFKRKIEAYSETDGSYISTIEVERVVQDVFYKVFRTEEYRMFPLGLSGATHEIIQYLMLDMSRDNMVLFDETEIADRLGLSVATVRKSKATILAHDIMRQKRRVHIFNPLYGCTVNGKDRQTIMEDFDKLPKWEPKKPKTKEAV